MVTKRRKPQSKNEQGASATPARPSVKGKAVARPNAGGKVAGVKGSATQAAGPADAARAASEGSAQAPKRRVPMPRSSSRLKGKQTVGSSAADKSAAPEAPSAAKQAAEQEEPAKKPARPKRFSVARAERAAKEAAERLAPNVEQADAEAAQRAVRSEASAESARRRTARRQRAKRFGVEPSADASSAGAEAPAAGEGTDGAEASRDGAASRKKARAKLRIPLPAAIALVALAAVAAVVLVFSWCRWWQYDDAADFQGLWYADGGSSTVTIDAEKINLTSDVSYSYQLDTGAKTITYAFGNLQGQGRYRFSVDRTELVITDGKDFSFWGNLFADIGWRMGQFVDGVQGKAEQRETAGDGVTVLDRTRAQDAGSNSQDAAAQQSGASDQAQEGGVSDDSGSGDSSAGSSAASSAGATDSTYDSQAGIGVSGGVETAGSNAVTLEDLENASGSGSGSSSSSTGSSPGSSSSASSAASGSSQ